MKPDVDMSNLNLRLPSTAAQNMIYAIIQNQIVMTITDIESAPLPSTECIHTFSGNPRNVLRN